MTWATQTAARTLAQEARGEPLEGQQAVAWVFRNRLETARWGHSLASVCLWRGQFSGWYVPSDPNFAYACGLGDDDPVLVAMEAIVDEVMAADLSSDPTNQSTHYYATSIAAPAWVTGDAARGIPAATFTVQIGAHRFYKGVA